ncbi:MAG: hypothetical protein Q4F11_09485 [Eubacteriales bacterium]|nr:hypothetical protein [Eubacteriales bacterium]
MHKSKKSAMLREGISYVLSFLLTVCITLITVLVIIRYGCFNEKILLNNMSTYGYYDFVYEDIMNDVEAITLPTGLPASVYEEAIESTYIYSDINGKISAQFKGEAYTSKSAEIKKNMKENINAYLAGQGYSITEEEQKSIDAYVTEVIKDYDKYISMPLGTYLVKAKVIFDKVFLIALAALAVISAVIIFVNLKLHKWVHRAMRYFSYSALGCALMMISIPGYFYIRKIHYRLALSPESFYHLATTYIDDILKLFLYFGLLWIVVAIILIITTMFAKKNIKKGHK